MEARDIMSWYRVGVLAALALLLSYAETFVPIPIPGVKLGLANIPVLVALAAHDEGAAVSIAAIKVLASGLLFGSPLTLAYSLAGTACSLILMVPLSRLKTMRLWMCSIAGAVAHEMGQLAVAALFLKSATVFYLTPLLSLAGIACGAISGFLASRLTRAWPEDLGIDPARITLPDLSDAHPRTAVSVGLVVLILLTVATFRIDDTHVLAAMAALSLMACLARRVSARAILRCLRLTLAMGAITLVAGLIVKRFGAAPDALCATLRLATISLSAQAVATGIRESEVTSTIAWLVRPLARLGLDVDGFTLATSVALTCVPRIGAIVRREREGQQGQGHLSLATIDELVPRVVRELAAAALTPEDQDCAVQGTQVTQVEPVKRMEQAEQGPASQDEA